MGTTPPQATLPMLEDDLDSRISTINRMNQPQPTYPEQRGAEYIIISDDEDTSEQVRKATTSDNVEDHPRILDVTGDFKMAHNNVQQAPQNETFVLRSANQDPNYTSPDISFTVSNPTTVNGAEGNTDDSLGHVSVSRAQKPTSITHSSYQTRLQEFQRLVDLNATIPLEEPEDIKATSKKRQRDESTEPEVSRPLPKKLKNAKGLRKFEVQKEQRKLAHLPGGAIYERSFQNKSIQYVLPLLVDVQGVLLNSESVQFKRNFVPAFLEENIHLLDLINTQILLDAYKALVKLDYSAVNWAEALSSSTSAKHMKFCNKLIKKMRERISEDPKMAYEPEKLVGSGTSVLVTKNGVLPDKKIMEQRDLAQGHLLTADTTYISCVRDNNVESVDRYLPGMSITGLPCMVCRKIGHKSMSCPSLTCATCGIRGHHFQAACSLNHICNKCYQRGHQKVDCPEKLAAASEEGMRCILCDSTDHSKSECSRLWRTFEPDEQTLAIIKSLPRSCSFCGRSGHLGRDCGLRGPTLPRKTSQKQRNLPVSAPPPPLLPPLPRAPAPAVVPVPALKTKNKNKKKKVVAPIPARAPAAPRRGKARSAAPSPPNRPHGNGGSSRPSGGFRSGQETGRGGRRPRRGRGSSA